MNTSMQIDILYEDDNVVAINKPSGLMTHPDGRSSEDTASDWFARTYPKSAEVGETQKLQNGTEILRPGIVHRLDRETSGVLVFAKTQQAHEMLKEAFQNHIAQKTYLAFIYGVPKERKGIINFPIGRSNKDFRLRSAQPKAKGVLRDAVTRWSIVSDNGTHSLITAMPETGRTHQIRVHMKAIHHPIVCDALYAPKAKPDLGFNRLGLHAWKLEIHLASGESKILIAPVPEDLAQAMRKFQHTEEILAQT